MWSPFSWELSPLEEAGGIEIVGPEVQGFGKVARIERSLDRAVKGADLIMIVAPAMSHRPYASMLAPILQDGQRVLLNPGRTGGALEFARTLNRFACSANVVLGETQTFIYAAERTGPHTVETLKEEFGRAGGAGAERPGDEPQQRRPRRPSRDGPTEHAGDRADRGGRGPEVLQGPGDA